MNTTHHRSAWGIALASVALAVTSGCGSQIATPPADVEGPVDETSSPTDNQGGTARPGRLPDAWDN